jgi:formylglycine-generating enzyme required for sulfatase activity
MARALLAAAVLAGACDPPEGPVSAPDPVERRTPAPAPAPADPDPEPAAVPEPAPEPVLAPDGTPMVACPPAPDGMACIPGGPFLRGRDDGPSNAHPRAQVWVSTFFIDRNEVTFAEFQACVAAGACEKAGPRYIDFDRPRQPINGISWFDARNFCQVQGKRLPTEAEWEKAARGTDGRLYPWGDEKATCEHAIIMGKEGRGCGVRKRGDKPETGYPAEVGSRPPNQFGVYDLSGNSYEWVADWYSRSYEHCGADCAGVDPKGPCGGADACAGYRHKVVRGGSWYWPAEYATTTFRRAHVPRNEPFHHFGFRCAASVEDAARLTGSTAPAEPAPSPSHPADR